ncbi:DgyrCDS14213 [Dimorphilus gyrociliatus]|uniref:DgyrCDS14213 n=1 Tax=Dimorphilus gyrociliatus TaxID=2664684 RepID=A0A7I8WD50_9ANNE|nr:DgyrCDS14213 [Dimorphilus gyrociliatus]
MQKSTISELGAKKRVKDEASIQSSFSKHPFIVKAFSFFQDMDNLNILMEYKPNGDLFALWKQSDRFSENLTRVYIAEIALGLDFLHKNGIIYRDLKMENILLDELGHISITDFGLSKCLSIGERTRTICGTLQYIAPEVLAMQTYTHSADWWSLGILMYSLLAGHFPVKPGKDHFEMAKMCSQSTYELPFYGNYSNEAKHIVKNLLEKDSRRRLHDIYSLQNQPFFQRLNFDVVFAKKIPIFDIILENCNQYTTKRINEIFSVLPPMYFQSENTEIKLNGINGDYINGFDYDATFMVGNRTYVWCNSIAQAKPILV